MIDHDELDPISRIASIIAPGDPALIEAVRPGAFRSISSPRTPPHPSEPFSEGPLAEYWHWFQAQLLQRRNAISLEFKEDECPITVPALARMDQLGGLLADWKSMVDSHHRANCGVAAQVFARLGSADLVLFDFGALWDDSTYSVCGRTDLPKLKSMAAEIGFEVRETEAVRLCRGAAELPARDMRD